LIKLVIKNNGNSTHVFLRGMLLCMLSMSINAFSFVFMKSALSLLKSQILV